jgi:hypothetical protein
MTFYEFCLFTDLAMVQHYEITIEKEKKKQKKVLSVKLEL